MPKRAFPLRRFLDYRIDSTSKIRASMNFKFFIFLQSKVVQKFLNLPYNNVMDLISSFYADL